MHLTHSLHRFVAFAIALAALPFVSLSAENPYPAGPDSKKQDNVPHGELIKGTFDQSKIFPGTTRDYTVYIPAGLDRAKPAPSMTLQDGGGYSAPNVFDNLIAKKEIPALVGIFVMHGRVKALRPNALDRFNRSVEYDGLGDSYARFLLEELYPFIEAKHDLKLSKDPNDRAIGGASSGAICAFTCAWERPDAFRRVYSSIGTYVGLRGGDEYPTLIRKTEPKPIRIFLQDGTNDLNIYGGDWWMANQMMERALVFAGYDVNHAWGTGAHDGNQATQVFPDALRWLWRDYPAPIVANPAGKSRQPVAKLLVPGEDWQLISEGHGFTEGPAANLKGEVFFTDIPNSRIHKISLDGKVTVFAEDTGKANGLMFGPDGKLYACASGKKQITAYDDTGKASVFAEGIDANDLSIDQHGNIYATEPGAKQISFISKSGEKRVVDKGGYEFPNGIRLSPDQSLLYVADSRGQFVWSYSVMPDGSLTNKQRYFHLHLPDGSTGSGADGMTVDTNGTLYVTTALGVQFCDQAGRVNGIIRKPQNKWLSNAVFGGADFSDLYVTCGDKVYRRKTTVRGVLTSQAPIKPRAPGL